MSRKLDLVTVAEVAKIYGVTYVRAGQIVNEKAFPEPAVILGRNRGWHRRDVLEAKAARDARHAERAAGRAAAA